MQTSPPAGPQIRATMAGPGTILERPRTPSPRRLREKGGLCGCRARASTLQRCKFLQPGATLCEEAFPEQLQAASLEPWRCHQYVQFNVHPAEVKVRVSSIFRRGERVEVDYRR